MEVDLNIASVMERELHGAGHLPKVSYRGINGFHTQRLYTELGTCGIECY